MGEETSLIQGTVRVPGSSANLGPGFDVLALAVSLYIDVRASLSDRFEVTAIGEGSEIEVNSDHLGAIVAREVLGHDNVHLHIRSEIPFARGLGSSAAFAVGVAYALGAKDPLLIATKLEGHPENAAASFCGGLVAAGVVDGEPVVERLNIDQQIGLVVVVPDARLSTAESRKTLTSSVTREDAVFNLQRAVLLSHALSNINHLREGLFDDRLHQSQRSRLFPSAISIIDVLVHSGAVGATWSGAGSSMIGFVDSNDSPGIVEEVRSHLKSLEIKAQVLSVEVDTKGARVLPSEAAE